MKIIKNILKGTCILLVISIIITVIHKAITYNPKVTIDHYIDTASIKIERQKLIIEHEKRNRRVDSLIQARDKDSNIDSFDIHELHELFADY